MFLLNNFQYLGCRRKYLSMRCRNVLPMLLFTLPLYCGLNHIIFLLRFVLGGGVDVSFNIFTSTPSPRRNRNRKIIWFNPQYSGNVKSNIGRIFLHLIVKHYSRQHKYHKLFNRNNIKISYSCMPNIASVIQNHNTSLLKNPIPTDIKESSCCQKADCPLDKKYLFWYLVCNALVDWLGTKKTKRYY